MAVGFVQKVDSDLHKYSVVQFFSQKFLAKSDEVCETMLAAVQQEQAEGRLGRPSARVVAALPARVRAVQRHQRTARTRWRIARDLIAVFTK